jgi:hypothetical protein
MAGMVKRCEKRTLKSQGLYAEANQCLFQCKRRWGGEQRGGGFGEEEMTYRRNWEDAEKSVSAWKIPLVAKQAAEK